VAAESGGRGTGTSGAAAPNEATEGAMAVDGEGVVSGGGIVGIQESAREVAVGGSGVGRGRSGAEVAPAGRGSRAPAGVTRGGSGGVAGRVGGAGSQPLLLGLAIECGPG